MLYTLDNIKLLFPKSNWEFTLEPCLMVILKAVEGRFVGGVVRDALLGIMTEDIDIATPFLPEEVLHRLTQLNFHPVATGIKYGTVSVFLKKYKIEITSLRKDVKTYGRKAEVSFGGTWEEDSLRRDFTFNALFLCIEDHQYYLYDYHGGLEDLRKGQVNFIGDYKERIKEDYLRIMRFVRFFLRYAITHKDFTSTLESFYEFIPPMKILSIERILMELNAILKCENWWVGIDIINTLGISKLFFQDNLFIPSLTNRGLIYSLNERFFIIFHRISLEVIKTLPLIKHQQLLLSKYITTDFTPTSLGRIWQKTKTLNLIVELIHFKYLIDGHRNFPIDLLREDNFNNYKKYIVFQHSFGPERGEEELQIKINFLKSLETSTSI